MLQRLPLFEEATVAEVLDIRRELEGPLRGFRLAVSDFSRQIRSAGWEPAFSEEADALFREKVQPEIEQIEEAVRENRPLDALARRVVRHGATRTTFGAVIGSVSDLSVLAGIAIGLGSAGVQAYLDQQERLREIQDKQLYFYDGVQVLLRRS